MSIPVVGEPLVDASLEDLNGKPVKLSEFKGKYLLLEFWSLTCFSCMNTAKELQPLHNDVKDKVEFIGINMDTEKSMWEQGTNRDGIVWTNLSDGLGSDGGIGQAYGVIGYPAFVLVDPEGIIIDRWMGFKPGRTAEKIKQVL